MRALFSDNLYGGTEIQGGTGLFASCGASAGWYYERHSMSCKPGKWRVGVFAAEWNDMVNDFHEALQGADAVVDDFGDLRRVS